MNTNTFQRGQVVKFAEPMSDDERGERFKVLEYLPPRPEIGDNAPARMKVRYVCDMALPPVSTYLASDMVPA